MEGEEREGKGGRGREGGKGGSGREGRGERIWHRQVLGRSAATYYNTGWLRR